MPVMTLESTSLCFTNIQIAINYSASIDKIFDLVKLIPHLFFKVPSLSLILFVGPSLDT